MTDQPTITEPAREPSGRDMLPDYPRLARTVDRMIARLRETDPVGPADAAEITEDLTIIRDALQQAAHPRVLYGVDPAHPGAASVVTDPRRPWAPADPAGLDRYSRDRYRTRQPDGHLPPPWLRAPTTTEPDRFRPEHAAHDALDTGNALGATLAVAPTAPRYRDDGTPVGSRIAAAIAGHRARLDRTADQPGRHRPDPAGRYRIGAGQDPVTGAQSDRIAYQAVDPDPQVGPGAPAAPAQRRRVGAAARAFGRDLARTLRRLAR